MALFGKFLKSKKESGSRPQKEPGAIRETGEAEVNSLPGGVARSSFSGAILIAHHVTEKSRDGVSLNKYSFKVNRDANKIEIKKAVGKKYGVKVLKVNVLNVKSKEVSLGGITGRSPGPKKAVVTLAAGQKIETGV